MKYEIENIISMNQQVIVDCKRLGLKKMSNLHNDLNADLYRLLLKANFDPNQQRVPAGNPNGGQWTDDDSWESLAENASEDNVLGNDSYNPEEDSWYMARYHLLSYRAKFLLSFYEDEIKEATTKLQLNGERRRVDPVLLKAVITNESITRLGGGLDEALVSYVREEFVGGFGTYGPAQLGPVARTDENIDFDGDGESDDISRLGAIRMSKAIEGAANFLDKERVALIEEGVEDPTHGQIASRYNNGNANVRNKLTVLRCSS